MKRSDVWLVEVKTTNPMKNRFEPEDNKYYDCENGFVYVIGDPEDIVRKFKKVLISIKYVGVGYTIEEK